MKQRYFQEIGGTWEDKQSSSAFTFRDSLKVSYKKNTRRHQKETLSWPCFFFFLMQDLKWQRCAKVLPFFEAMRRKKKADLLQFSCFMRLFVELVDARHSLMWKAPRTSKMFSLARQEPTMASKHGSKIPNEAGV